MAMKKRAVIGQQLDVMSVLWEHGPATVRQIHGGLETGISYREVRSLVHGLEARGSVRAELEGGLYRYHPAVTREQVGRRAVGRVLRQYFGGSIPAFLRAVVEASGCSHGVTDDSWS